MGLDASLKATALVSLTEKGVLDKYKIIETTPKKPYMERLFKIQEEAEAFMAEFGPFSVGAIETPFYGPNKLTGKYLAGVWGALLVVCQKHKIPQILDVHPSYLKKFVTKKAHAQKDEMRLGTYKLWLFEDPSNDVVDAFGLAQMARCYAQPDKYHQFQSQVVRDFMGIQDAAGTVPED